MRAPVRPVKAGEIMAFLEGYCSDHDLSGVFRAARDFDPLACLSAWRRETGNGNEEFVPFLSRKGFIEGMPYHRLQIDEYELKARSLRHLDSIEISAFGFQEQES